MSVFTFITSMYLLFSLDINLEPCRCHPWIRKLAPSMPPICFLKTREAGTVPGAEALRWFTEVGRHIFSSKKMALLRSIPGQAGTTLPDSSRLADQPRAAAPRTLLPKGRRRPDEQFFISYF